MSLRLSLMATQPRGDTMRIHYLIIGAMATAVAVAAAFPAHATLQVAAQFGATTFNCVDNDNTCDTNLSTGTIQIANQTIGGITVNGSVQTSTGTPANPGTDILNTSSLNLINTLGIAVAYTVTISDTDFSAPVNQFAATTAGTWQTAVGSTTQTRLWADAANVQ